MPVHKHHGHNPDDEALRAASYLGHYHVCHTTDKITQFKGEDEKPDGSTVQTFIYVTSDPEWIAKFSALIALEFPDPGKEEREKKTEGFSYRESGT